MRMELAMAQDDRTSNVARWRWALWLVCLGIWTAALLRPEPAVFNREVIAPHFDFPLSKILHMGAYAFLTVFAGTLPMTRRHWLLLVAATYLRATAGWRGRRAAVMALVVLGCSIITWRAWGS